MAECVITTPVPLGAGGVKRRGFLPNILQNQYHLLLFYHMENITKDFSWDEFFRSRTAELHGIDNIPNDPVIYDRIRALTEECLQPLRRALQRPVIITSGYRCERLNQLVHGMGDSQHLYGEAADLRVRDRDEARWMFRWIVEHGHLDQLLFEHFRGCCWLHLIFRSDRGRNRHQAIFNYQVKL